MSVFFGQVRQELEEMRKKYDEMRNKYKEMKTEVSYDSCNSVLCLFVQYVCCLFSDCFFGRLVD